MKQENPFSIRLATAEDIPALRALIDVSVRVLQRADYWRNNWMQRSEPPTVWIRS